MHTESHNPMVIDTLPLPPGSTGWPLVGEALALTANPFKFMGDRATRHGVVTRSRLMNKDLAILAGPEAAAIFLDEANIRRAGGLPPHAADLFGAGVVNQIDGDEHRRRKRHLMHTVDAEALAHYLPVIRRHVRARVAQWSKAGEIKLQDACIVLTQELIFANFAGLEPDEATLLRYARGYADFGKALFGLPLALPGTPLARARAFSQEMRQTFSQVVEARRTAPTGDGVSRLVASEVDGEHLATQDIARELQHLMFAASGLSAWFCYGAQALAQDDTLADRLRAVVSQLGADPSGRELLESPELVAFVREVKRLALLIPITAIGVARQDFAVAGHRIPKGWLVLWSTYASHTSANVAPYASAERFDPSRYERGEGEAPHHFAPQGPGEALTSHRCAGVEYSTLVLLQFFVELLRAPRLTLPAQDLSIDMSQLPASWRSGLRVRFGTPTG
ncbi:MAG: cytochrome P450 [Bradymonadaceae bacterium]|nr:cytochrome P450 [Lujinxingiaceae bacterium]